MKRILFGFILLFMTQNSFASPAIPQAAINNLPAVIKFIKAALPIAANTLIKFAAQSAELLTIAYHVSNTSQEILKPLVITAQKTVENPTKVITTVPAVITPVKASPPFELISPKILKTAGLVTIGSVLAGASALKLIQGNTDTEKINSKKTDENYLKSFVKNNYFMGTAGMIVGLLLILKSNNIANLVT